MLDDGDFVGDKEIPFKCCYFQNIFIFLDGFYFNAAPIIWWDF